jgi:hypothetical protein
MSQKTKTKINATEKKERKAPMICKRKEKRVFFPLRPKLPSGDYEHGRARVVVEEMLVEDLKGWLVITKCLGRRFRKR